MTKRLPVIRRATSNGSYTNTVSESRTMTNDTLENNYRGEVTGTSRWIPTILQRGLTRREI